MDDKTFKEFEQVQKDTEKLRNQSILIGVNLVGEFVLKSEQQNYTKKQLLAIIRLVRAGAKETFKID
jgi:hypothetical protein|tara:strand:- start:17505 stop:17705 length:201 start_codon:yes stop_codon:yes gene_type:complete